MPFHLNLIYKKKDIGFGQSSKWKVVCPSKMHHVSKNWKCISYFQYKVTIGQCDRSSPNFVIGHIYNLETIVGQVCQKFTQMQFEQGGFGLGELRTTL